MPKILQDYNNINYVFISYCHNENDLPWIYQELDKLYDKGLNFWFDDDIIIGENWREKATKHMCNINCLGVIFFVSEPILYEMTLYLKQREIRDMHCWCVHLDGKSTNNICDIAFKLAVESNKLQVFNKSKSRIYDISPPDETYGKLYRNGNSDNHVEKLIEEANKFRVADIIPLLKELCSYDKFSNTNAVELLLPKFKQVHSNHILEYSNIDGQIKDKSILLSGDGGMGKTTFLKYLYNKSLKSERNSELDKLMIYIPFGSLKSRILDNLVNNLFRNTLFKPEQLLNRLFLSKTKLILLLDAINEVDPDKQKMFWNDINYLISQGFICIITTRDSSSIDKEIGLEIEQYYAQPQTKETILEYIGCDESILTPQMLKHLGNTLLLTKYIELYDENYDLSTVLTPSELLNIYFYECYKNKVEQQLSETDWKYKKRFSGSIPTPIDKLFEIIEMHAYLKHLSSNSGEPTDGPYHPISLLKDDYLQMHIDYLLPSMMNLCDIEYKGDEIYDLHLLHQSYYSFFFS